VLKNFGGKVDRCRPLKSLKTGSRTTEIGKMKQTFPFDKFSSVAPIQYVSFHWIVFIGLGSPLRGKVGPTKLSNAFNDYI